MHMEYMLLAQGQEIFTDENNEISVEILKGLIGFETVNQFYLRPSDEDFENVSFLYN